MERPNPSPRDLLADAIAKSGMSARQFATQLMGRDERTIRRWQSGDSPIPEAASAWLRRYVEATPP